MNIIRKPCFNAIVISVISAFYAAVFIVCSGHMEFERILNHSTTLNSALWNGWSEFLRQGQIKYVGVLFILLAAIIVVLSLVRKQDYDEYQSSILEKGLIVSGVVMVLLLPIVLLSILSDRSYAVEYITLLVVVHWLAVLAADLVYVVRWGRN